jgi:glycosyltransferase involved in cell wall biosynthesis
MDFELNEYTTAFGEIILYNGSPNFEKLEELSKGAGDLWHSSFEQGYKNAFPELVYQTAVFFWYLNDFDNLEQCISWRINPNAFAVRKSVWELTQGFDTDFENSQMQALDFGFRFNRFMGGVPLYVQNLFPLAAIDEVILSRNDRHLFFRKNFKISHAIYMIYRMGFWKISEWKAFLYCQKKYVARTNNTIIPPRKLEEIKGNPTASYIIPTLFRQEYTLQLLGDLTRQNYLPAQVIVIDATPQSERDEKLYQSKKYPFELIVKWQETEGSCRARNEAIAFCTSDYIFFGDDDIRIPADFIENHIRLLETYQAGACNGLDIRADHYSQDLNDLKNKLAKLDSKRFIVGNAQSFSNANSCAKKIYVDQLVGNDVNFDGGYGEDSDFGMSLTKIGVTVLNNPFSVNLHLKPSSGGYRFWGSQAKIMGKKRKRQPWELDVTIKWVRPVPSPTIVYGIIKQFKPQQLVEYKHKYFSYYLFDGSKLTFMYRLLRLSYKNFQFKKAVFYARKLINLGIRHY